MSRRIKGTIAVTALLSLVLAGCSTKSSSDSKNTSSAASGNFTGLSTEGVTNSTITLGWMGALTGLAPAWIGVGTLDLFHDEDLAYADRLRSAGVSCAVSEVDGAFHGFDLIVPKATVSRAFTEAQIAALLKALDGVGLT